MPALDGELTYFYVRVPEDQNVGWRIRHADETVQVAGAFFTQTGKDIYTPPGRWHLRGPCTLTEQHAYRQGHAHRA